MPHLENCSHSGDGWCLACVQRLQADLARAMPVVEAAWEFRSARERAMEVAAYNRAFNPLWKETESARAALFAALDAAKGADDDKAE